MSLAKFRQHYPQGSLVSELVEIDRGIYIVQASIEIDGVVLATALGGAAQVETAEDIAQTRAIASLCLDAEPRASSKQIDSIAQVEHSAAAPQTKEKTAIKPAINSPQTQLATSQSPPILPEIKPKSEPIVNFSKAQEKSKLQNSAEAKFPLEDDLQQAAVLDTSESLTQEEAAVDPSSSNQSNNNLFGDTFEAAIPEEVAVAETNPSGVDSQATSEVTISPLEVMDFNEIKQRTDIEIKRLGWTKEQGKEFLMSHYGKRSRLHLTDEQLLEFLRYLEKLPNPLK